MWELRRISTGNIDLTVTGKSTFDFTHQLLEEDPVSGDFYEISGRPLAGSNTTVTLRVTEISVITGVHTLMLLDQYGQIIKTSILEQGVGKNTNAYRGSIVIPNQAFTLAINGTDRSGHTFQRLSTSTLLPVSIKLDIESLGTLFVHESMLIRFTLTNVGADGQFEVNATDDKHLLRPPLTQSFVLKQGENKTGSFTISGGSAVQITRVTFSAGLKGGDTNDRQLSVKTVSVTRRPTTLKPPDREPPSCTLISVDGNCTAAQINPCVCRLYRWSAVAEARDTDSGLATLNAGGISAAIPLISNFSVGDKNFINVNITATCCNPRVTINAGDLEGNLGQCVISFIDDTLALNYSSQQCITTTEMTTVTETTQATTDAPPTSDFKTTYHGFTQSTEELTSPSSLNSSLGAQSNADMKPTTIAAISVGASLGTIITVLLVLYVVKKTLAGKVSSQSIASKSANTWKDANAESSAEGRNYHKAHELYDI
ncbi:uncharacterized protein LOC106158945 [Lingula anatina]|uniref:Uncharacterized protein LOC106158945 n=1 Tax=Lingula anatina TaxID=7574 RepID=A0A1S3HWY5_LINAN|nr:uncharacterized protein LOC106158945 [Lingula anatina]|eukprot:XP_013390528.1 uncharacterized protein LOC106158945 [Lingula anatina]